MYAYTFHTYKLASYPNPHDQKCSYTVHSTHICARAARPCIGGSARMYQFTVNHGLRASVFQSEQRSTGGCASRGKIKARTHRASLGLVSVLPREKIRSAGRYETNQRFLRIVTFSPSPCPSVLERFVDERPKEFSYRSILLESGAIGEKTSIVLYRLFQNISHIRSGHLRGHWDLIFLQCVGVV